MKSILHLLLTLPICLLWYCEPTKKERPSPLRTDSIAFNSGQLKIKYSSPAVTSKDGVNREGKIWGELVPFDTIWRTGANEATVFSTTVPIKVNGSEIDSGSYALFTIPSQDEWIVILNENWNQWGTYDYDSSLNVMKLVLPAKQDSFSERMIFSFKQDSLKFNWERRSFSLLLE